MNFKLRGNCSNYLYVKRGQIIAFSIAIGLTLVTLIPQTDMLQGIGDPTDIWKTISTFYSDKVEPSYVLYKGFLSIYPYVWLVKLSQLFGFGDWVFLKILHSVLFALITAIGIPNILSRLLKIEIKPWRRALFVVAGFFLWRSTHVIQTIMIDLPSLFFFVFSVSAALKIADRYKELNKLYFLYAGLLFGCASLYTGQYAPSISILILFVIISMFYKKIADNSARLVSLIISLLILCTGYAVPKAYNEHFNNTFVKQFEGEGVSANSSDEWIEIGIGQAKRRYTMFWGPTILNNRSYSIMMDDKGEGYDDFIEHMSKGGIYTVREVIKLVIKHPVDFITSWCNGFLLTVSMNTSSNSIPFLFISYTALFTALFILFKRWKTFKGIFCKETLLIFTFVLPALVTCVFHYEPRYVIGFQGLFLGAAIFDDTFWNIFKNGAIIVKECIKSKKLTPIITWFNEAKFPYTFIIYCVFVLMCFSNYAAIYESVGVDKSILFKW